MAFKLTINSVDVTANVLIESVSVSLRANERSTASFTLKPGHTCAALDAVEIFELNGTTRKFVGVVFPGPATQGVTPATAAYFTNVECVDLWGYLDWSFWDKTYTSDFTLHDLISDAVTDVLSAFGMSVDAGQDTGPTFTASAENPIVISSPVSTSAISPPAAASGDTCPIESPDVPPENRPSVTRAHAAPSPRPLRNDVG